MWEATSPTPNASLPATCSASENIASHVSLIWINGPIYLISRWSNGREVIIWPSFAHVISMTSLYAGASACVIGFSDEWPASIDWSWFLVVCCSQFVDQSLSIAKTLPFWPWSFRICAIVVKMILILCEDLHRLIIIRVLRRTVAVAGTVPYQAAVEAECGKLFIKDHQKYPSITVLNPNASLQRLS